MLATILPAYGLKTLSFQSNHVPKLIQWQLCIPRVLFHIDMTCFGVSGPSVSPTHQLPTCSVCLSGYRLSLADPLAF